jgi:hypothetical protein
VCPTSLWRSWFLRRDRPCGDHHHREPTPPFRACRVNGERELADEECLPPARSARERSCPRVAARGRRVSSPIGRSRSARHPRSEHGHDRACSSNAGHRAPTSAIDAKPEHTRAVTVTPPAPWLPTERRPRNRSLRAASMAEPHPPAVPSPEARAWLHGGPDGSGRGHSRRRHGRQRVLEHCYATEPTKAAAAHPRERASRGRGRSAFQS